MNKLINNFKHFIIFNIFLIVLIILILISKLINADNFIIDEIKININGNKNITIEYQDEYLDEGATAKLCHKKDCQDYTENISITNNVDTNKIGKYEVIYSIKYRDKEYIENRIVTVTDSIEPTITLLGEETISICPNQDYNEAGYTAIDNYDGDISDKVAKTMSDNAIIYTIKDSSGNTSTAKRELKYVDDIKPQIKLYGSKTITLNLNETFNEPGYIATDNCMGTITSNVKVTNNVNTSVQGTYEITYEIIDNAGNISKATRTVKVIKQPSFNTTNKNEYMEALTSYINNKGYKVSVGYYNLQTGSSYYYKPTTVYYGASLVKTVAALYTYEKLTLTPELKGYVSKAITVSDNPSHHKLIEKIGINNLRQYGRSLGATKFLTGNDSDHYGSTTVNDQIKIWQYLYKYINSHDNGSELKSYFINSECNFLLYPGIPTTMHKYGELSPYFHDVGIVFDSSPYIVVILTKEFRGDYQNIIKDLSQKINTLNKLK